MRDAKARVSVMNARGGEKRTWALFTVMLNVHIVMVLENVEIVKGPGMFGFEKYKVRI